MSGTVTITNHLARRETDPLNSSATPFLKYSVADTDPNEIISATITNGVSGSAAYTVSDPHGFVFDPTTGTYTFSGTADQLTAAIQGFTLNTGTNYGAEDVLTVNVYDSTGASAGFRGAAFVDTPPPPPGVVTVDTSGVAPSQVITADSNITPFAAVKVSDTNPNETITASFVDPLSQAATVTNYNGFVFNGTNADYEFTGTAAQVQSAIDGVTFGLATTDPGVADNVILTVKDSTGATVLGLNTQLKTPDAPVSTVPTTAQIKGIVTDTIKFYSDSVKHLPTAADLTKLTTDLKGLNLTQDTLGSVLTSALQADAGSNAGVLGADLAKHFFPAINNDLNNNTAALPKDVGALVTETALVGGTYKLLTGVFHESASTALAQTIAAYHIG